MTYGCRTARNRGCNYISGKVVSLSCSWYDISNSDLASIVLSNPLLDESCGGSRVAEKGVNGGIRKIVVRFTIISSMVL